MAKPNLLPAALQRPEPIPLDQLVCWGYPQAEQATGLCQPTLRKAINELGCPHARIGDRVLFEPESLKAWIRSRLITLPPSDAPPAVADDAAE